MPTINSVNFRGDLRPVAPNTEAPPKEVAAAQQVFLNTAENSSATQEKAPVKKTFWEKFEEKASRAAQHRTALLASFAALVLLGIIAALYSGPGKVPPAQPQKPKPTPSTGAASNPDSKETPAGSKAPAAAPAAANSPANKTQTLPGDLASQTAPKQPRKQPRLALIPCPGSKPEENSFCLMDISTVPPNADFEWNFAKTSPEPQTPAAAQKQAPKPDLAPPFEAQRPANGTTPVRKPSKGIAFICPAPAEPKLPQSPNHHYLWTELLSDKNNHSFNTTKLSTEVISLRHPESNPIQPDAATEEQRPKEFSLNTKQKLVRWLLWLLSKFSQPDAPKLPFGGFGGL